MGVLIRSLLSAVSVVLLIPAAIAVWGGFLPRVMPLGLFGAVLNTGLPWVLADAALATGVAGVAVALGGRKTFLLFAAGLATVGGALFVGYSYMTFAQAHGATYDLIRAIDGFPPIPEPTKKVVFATVDGVDLKADLWLPHQSSTDARHSHPAVVFVHGGSFLGGAPGTRPLLMSALQEAGVVGVDIDYRLAPPPRWNQAPGDVLCALAWAATSPDLTVVDTRKVVIVGESAGGNLALMAGYSAGTDALASSCPKVGPPIVPVGVLAIAPTADLAGIWADHSIFDFSGNPFPEAYIGGAPAQFPDRYDAASPFRLLRDNLPPTLILAGETDHHVRIEHSRALCDRITAAGAQCTLLEAPFASHGFDGEPNSFGDQLVEVVVRDFVLRAGTQG